MPTDRPRIQVTVDEELERALAHVDAAGRSRARLLRDLALKGVAATGQEERELEQARALLVAIADGDDRYDLSASGALHEARGDRLP